MSRRFLDVFPDLVIAEELRELLKLAEVERVSSTRDRSTLRIYLASPRLIHKKKYIRSGKKASGTSCFPAEG